MDVDYISLHGYTRNRREVRLDLPLSGEGTAAGVHIRAIV